MSKRIRFTVQDIPLTKASALKALRDGHALRVTCGAEWYVIVERITLLSGDVGYLAHIAGAPWAVHARGYSGGLIMPRPEMALDIGVAVCKALRAHAVTID